MSLRRACGAPGASHAYAAATRSPSPQVEAAKACAKRLQKRSLKVKLAWILRKRARGF